MLYEIKTDVKESDLRRAEVVLDSMGLSLHSAIGIFITHIARTERFPFALGRPIDTSLPEDASSFGGENLEESDGNDRAAVNAVESAFGERQEERKIVRITPKMAEIVWDVFFRAYTAGSDNKIELKKEIVSLSGMSEGSAYIYIVFLFRLVSGSEIKRGMKLRDIEYFLTQVNNFLPKSARAAAKRSVKKSMRYWEKIVGKTGAERLSSLVSEER
jgi:antitoxin component of RelBE/YafQ-DinJ toxin-antitoxin module